MSRIFFIFVPYAFLFTPRSFLIVRGVVFLTAKLRTIRVRRAFRP